MKNLLVSHSPKDEGLEYFDRIKEMAQHQVKEYIRSHSGLGLYPQSVAPPL